jgi:hypothetical protein
MINFDAESIASINSEENSLCYHGFQGLYFDYYSSVSEPLAIGGSIFGYRRFNF